MEMTEYVKKEDVIKLIDTMKKYLDTVTQEVERGVKIKCAVHMVKRFETLSNRIDELDYISIRLNER